MRSKVVPPVREVVYLYEAAEAIPLVPGSVEDCCIRLRDRTDLASRDEARELLTFLEALGLVAEAERGFHRVREPPSKTALAEAFETEVFAVRESRGAVANAEGPLTAEAVFDQIRETVPRWERNHHPDWEAVWLARVERLLEWSVAFDILDETGEGYRLA